MTSGQTESFTPDTAIKIIAPERQTTPVVFSSPHSGRVYPADFLVQSQLDPHALRASEDAFVDELFSGVADLGAPQICAQFPRVYLDVNRDPLELDPTMFEDALPERADTTSARVLSGIGTIARIVGNDQAVYKTRMPYSEAKKRLESCYFPYHKALQDLINQTVERFGTCLLVDCHSMPSPHHSNFHTPKGQRAEIVLGDRWGASCDRSITEITERTILSMGYSVRCNTPYAGGYTTQHYGQPDTGVQAIQIEIDRSLYMNERSITRLPVFESVRERMTGLAQSLCSLGMDKIAAQ
jgi:N-formylglutamate amidohydrolase